MKQQGGFSLLEVLVAMLILSISTLGLARGQLLALQQTKQSLRQSLQADTTVDTSLKKTR